jgi:SOS-response transcriptional repressor LexA
MQKFRILNMEFKDRVKQRMDTLGIRATDISERLKVSRATVTFWLNGTNGAKGKNLLSLAELLDCSPTWLETGMGEPPKSGENVSPAFRPFKKASSYPVISWIAAGQKAESPQDYISGANKWLESDQNAGEHGYWLEVKGKSMVSDSSPSFLPGTYVLVQPEGFDLISGKYYIAQHRDGERTFKQYVYDAGKEYLAPLNPSFETVQVKDDWEFIGRVVDVKITGL